jgi:protein subunit release factor A
MGNESKALELLKAALEELRNAKPEERSELARRYAVTITELEKAMSYYLYFVESQI